MKYLCLFKRDFSQSPHFSIALTMLFFSCHTRAVERSDPHEAGDNPLSSTPVIKIQHRQRSNLPLTEISGLTEWLSPNCQTTSCMAALGDSTFEIATFALEGHELKNLKIHDMTPALAEAGLLAGFERDQESQWEAIASDSSGQIYALSEGSSTILVFDPTLTKVLRLIKLRLVDSDLQMDTTLNGASQSITHSVTNSGGEGLTVLPNGRFLVAFERSPMRLVEFAPSDSDSRRRLDTLSPSQDTSRASPQVKEEIFVELQSWKASRELEKFLGDISDLRIFKNEIYVLSDQSESIARVNLQDSQSQRFRVDRVWKLDDFKGKPEGFAFLSDSSLIVASDRKRDTVKNLSFYDPLP